MQGRDLGRALGVVTVALALAAATPAGAQNRAGAELERLYADAVELFRNTKWEAAERAFTELARRAPGAPEPYLYLGRLAAVRKAPERAETLLRRAIELKPDFVEAHHTLGVLYLDQRNYARARESFATVLRLDPSRPLARVNAGTAAARLGRFEEAAEHFEKALELGRDDASVRLLASAQLGVVLLELGRIEPARLALEEAVRIAPDDGTLQTKLSDVYDALGRELTARRAGREGLELFRDYAARFPDRPLARVLLGEALLRSENLSAALAEFERALAADPTFARAHFAAGFVSKQLGENERARSALEAARRLEPENTLVLFHLGELVAEDGDPDSAALLLQQAVALRPDYAQAYRKLGQVYVRARRYQEALAALAEAARLEPELPETHYLLARAYLGLGEREKAAESERRFRELDRRRQLSPQTR